MAQYKLKDMVKTFEKLFTYGIDTTEKVANIEWQDLDKIGEFTPFDKSLIMDFKLVIAANYKANKKKINYGIVEFLVGKKEANDG